MKYILFSKKKLFLLIGGLFLMISCVKEVPEIYLGQGIISGEISENSVILQTRLTSTEHFKNGELKGAVGVGKFEFSTDSTFNTSNATSFFKTAANNDHIIKYRLNDLEPGTRYYYKLHYGITEHTLKTSETHTFKTIQGAKNSEEVRFAVVTGMNYYKFHYGDYDSTKAYMGEDKHLGYPALEAIKNLKVDYFIGTGDNVYFDHPKARNLNRAKEAGKTVGIGNHNGDEVSTEDGMRKKYHEQFSQIRFKELFKNVGTYWEKDDHDYRYNDADPFMKLPISHELGIKNFREQLPVTDPIDPHSKTYRTHRLNKDVQIWLLEGRDYRSPNQMMDGPEKTMLGKQQISWLQESLLQSDATFKLIISPTPMVGPDDAYKSDNHVNTKGFRYEGDMLFSWFKEHGFLQKNLFFICGDRHWQYHAIHPSGFEEFSTGALIDANARAGRMAGDPNSSDPDALIKQLYIQGTTKEASGGFLMVEIKRKQGIPLAIFKHYDENGTLLYSAIKE